MASPDLRTLQIHPDAADPELALQQQLFNALVQDVATWRAGLAEWKERTERYHQAVGPAWRMLRAAWRDWVLALDHASLLPGLVRAEREQLRGLLCETAAQLLAHEDDAEIAAVVRRHEATADSSPPDHDTAGSEAGATERMDDLTQDWEQQAAAAAARRADAASKRRTAATAKRGRQAQQEASQSLRDVYRRLASALHPDREQDARQRERKTALMQLANQAYADQNLMALLELQLQAEQIDAAHLAGISQRRLGHYITVLQEQLADLQAETRRLESQFRSAVGLPPGSGLQARKADRMISSQAQGLRNDSLLLQRQARLLHDVEATKLWLREERKG